MWLTNKERDALEKAIKMNEIMVEVINTAKVRDAMVAAVAIKEINANLRCVLERDAAGTEGL